jgi:hypothetical protein
MSPMPFFVDPPAKETEGVDYLGLRTLNLNMMDGLLPGINNVVSRVRPFTLLCWIVWRFEQAGKADLSLPASQFAVFREKVETVFVMSQVQAGTGAGLAGVQQTVPSGADINFQFKSFQRTVSLIAAVQYGPALNTLNGLGFVRSPAPGSYKTAGEGTSLALVMDQRLRKYLTPEQYVFISSVHNHKADRDSINENFHGAWDVTAPSDAEKSAFRAHFLRPKATGVHGDRAVTLQYIIALLGELSAPVTHDTLRRAMACSFPQTLLSHPRKDDFVHFQRYWQLLQVRQAQRLALEALFGWVERCLVSESAATLDDLVELAMAALGVEPRSAADDDWMVSTMGRLRAAAAQLDQLFQKGLHEPDEWDIFQRSECLEAACKDKAPAGAMVVLGVQLLLLTTRFAELLAAEPETSKEVSTGLANRLPLGRLADVIRGIETQRLSNVLGRVLGSYVISQHLGVAAARSGDERSRMRITIEDRGLVSVHGSREKCLSPVRTADRLRSALSLMAECGLITRVPTPALMPLYGAVQLAY